MSAGSTQATNTRAARADRLIQDFAIAGHQRVVSLDRQPLCAQRGQVLHALLPGSQLTVEQLARETGQRRREVSKTVQVLAAAGLIGRCGLRRSAWQAAPGAFACAETPDDRPVLGARPTKVVA